MSVSAEGKEASSAGAESVAADQRISIAAHPQAKRLVRRAREAAGACGFLLAGWVALPTHTLAGTLVSALVAGIACQLVVWAAAVLLSRPLIIAQLRERELALVRAYRERQGASAAAERPGAENPARARLGRSR